MYGPLTQAKCQELKVIDPWIIASGSVWSMPSKNLPKHYELRPCFRCTHFLRLGRWQSGRGFSCYVTKTLGLILQRDSGSDQRGQEGAGWKRLEIDSSGCVWRQTSTRHATPHMRCWPSPSCPVFFLNCVLKSVDFTLCVFLYSFVWIMCLFGLNDF